MSIDNKTEDGLSQFPVLEKLELNMGHHVLLRKAFGHYLITIVSPDGREQRYDIRTTVHQGVLIEEINNYLEKERLQPTH